MQIKELGEIALIERLARSLKRDSSVLVGIGDDAAVIRWTKKEHMLLACDMLIEDVHFRLKEATPFQIGWKALAVNVSDIAAMGGLPRYAVVSIGVDPHLPVSFIDGLYDGMKALAKKFGVNIVGGDTNGSKKLVIDVALVGTVEKDKLVTRGGAKKGDLILLTGSIGGSIKGRHLDFVPRLKESRKLVGNFKINSMIDVSDGLLLDLARILRASEKGAFLYENYIPLSKDAGSFDEAVRAGEDFELLFTISVSEARKLFKRVASFGTDISLIGEVVDRKEGFKLVEKSGRIKDIKARGYTHF
jgi:thiamine-monophosphate kinase